MATGDMSIWELSEIHPHKINLALTRKETILPYAITNIVSASFELNPALRVPGVNYDLPKLPYGSILLPQVHLLEGMCFLFGHAIFNNISPSSSMALSTPSGADDLEPVGGTQDEFEKSGPCFQFNFGSSYSSPKFPSLIDVKIQGTEFKKSGQFEAVIETLNSRAFITSLKIMLLYEINKQRGSQIFLKRC